MGLFGTWRAISSEMSSITLSRNCEKTKNKYVRYCLFIRNTSRPKNCLVTFENTLILSKTLEKKTRFIQLVSARERALFFSFCCILFFSLLNFAPCPPRCFLELFAVPIFFEIKYSFSSFFCSQI